MLNRYQWLVLGVGLLILGSYLLYHTADCSPRLIEFGKIAVETKSGEIVLDEQDAQLLQIDALLLIACNIRRYMVSVPALFAVTFGWIFLILGWLEPKKH